MISTDKTRVLVCFGQLFFGLVCLSGNSPIAAQEEPNEALIQMVAELITDADRDMRALGFQQVREEVPGEAATRKFAELLPKLPPDGQAGLLEALGDRGDASARPVVLEMLGNKADVVRAAALQALGALGGASDVPLLAQKATEGSDPERNAARQSLVKLRGDDVTAALIAALGEGTPTVRVELLSALAARNAKEALPDVLKSAAAPEPSVRLAAIGALRFLADAKDTPALVKIVKDAGDDSQRGKAALTLLATCSRGREACTDAVIAGLADAEAPSRIVLLRALARAGGSKALATLVARLNDPDQAVRDEAVRMLSGWPDRAAKSHLLSIAKAADSPRRQVLAIRGLVRLAGPQEDQPADLDTLAEVLGLAERPEEKRLVLGVLGGLGTPQSLQLVAPALDDPALSEEAGLAAVMIAERIEDGDKEQIRAAMKKVLQVGQGRLLRDRAQKVLVSL